MKKFLILITLLLIYKISKCQNNDMMNNSEVIQSLMIPVTIKIQPIIDCEKQVFINDVVQLTLIQGLRPEDLTWKCDTIIVKTNVNYQVIFSKAGIYYPIINGIKLQSFYAISVM